MPNKDCEDEHNTFFKKLCEHMEAQNNLNIKRNWKLNYEIWPPNYLNILPCKQIWMYAVIIPLLNLFMLI